LSARYKLFDPHYSGLYLYFYKEPVNALRETNF
jgi:hypothetical protein